MSMCPRCGAQYDPVRSVGKWECSWHGNASNFDLHLKRWTCCGGVKNSKGCKRCDHGPSRQPIDAITHFRRLLRLGDDIDASQLLGLEACNDKPWSLHFSAPD